MEKKPEVQMDDVRLKIDNAQKMWAEIKCEMQKVGMDGSGNLSVKKENLKNLLEEIRRNLETCVLGCNDNLFKRIVINLLKRILNISDDLGSTYAFAGYVESYYISDTIEMAKR